MRESTEAPQSEVSHEQPAALPGLTGRRVRRAVYRAERLYGDHEEADRAFAWIRETRLLEVAAWGELARSGLRFALYDELGRPKARGPAEAGDFVGIAPAPLLPPFWWVRVEVVERRPALARMLLRPSWDPTARPPDPTRTAHFFTRAATLAITLAREGASLVAEVEGRDEQANAGAEAGGWLAAIANRVLAEAGWGLTGSVGGFLSLQQRHWEAYVAGLLAESQSPNS